MEEALNYLRKEGHEVKTEDVARLSPLGCDNINFLGRYSFGSSTLNRGGFTIIVIPACL
jgi:hypothetical protein